ncbi:MAG: class I SAM-dependent methyltransferase [Dehalococcoidales bacterium]|nr:MAG: class I SAM-dependent methyltransferase [Dehalococcoidales bacterium]
MKDFVQYYTEYDEDGRLQRHRTEFASTTYVLDKFIHPGCHILDVGAGTGPYSLYYAEKGCPVVAIDAVPKYIEILRSRLKSQPHLHIEAFVADVRDLSFPVTTNFDVILFMGPVYHVPPHDIGHCLDTCLHFLKKDGILAVSYVNAYEGHERDIHADMIIFHSPAEIEQLLSEFDLSRICHVPTDGVVFGELNELAYGQEKEIGELHAWLDKNQHVLYDSEWISSSIHCLYVGKKTK